VKPLHPVQKSKRIAVGKSNQTAKNVVTFLLSLPLLGAYLKRMLSNRRRFLNKTEDYLKKKQFVF
jgi:hypothetical protein